MSVKGELKFSNFIELERTVKCPNIMGFFSYIPKLECNHFIVSMKHDIKGSLLVNSKNYNFSDGIGYIEKDWGKSFPTDYIWLQCNHFENEKIKLTLSAATIPFLGGSFRGFFCSLIIDNKQYRFATYNFSKLIINSMDDKSLNVTLKKKHLKLDVSASVNTTHPLASPRNGLMNESIKEGLGGKVSIVLHDMRKETKIKSDGTNAGIEIMMKA